ncbi:hypothetical protein BV22DRAFT_992525, partial [Leucogyrophana mollusca]
WTPGHVGIEGNKHADELAKEAVKGTSSAWEHLPLSLCTQRGETKILPKSKSAVKQSHQKQLKAEATEAMTHSLRYSTIARIDPSTPSNHFAKI